MNFTKMEKIDLDSPRRELFVCGLGFGAALSVCWYIDFFVRLLWKINPAVVVQINVNLVCVAPRDGVLLLIKSSQFLDQFVQ